MFDAEFSDYTFTIHEKRDMPAHKKSLELKFLHGSRLRGVERNTKPAFASVPELNTPPSWLHPLAKREWRRVVAEFAGSGLLKLTDLATLAAFCQAYARWKTAEAIVDAEGQTVNEPVITRSGNPTGRYRVKRHPASVIAKDERLSMLRAASLFGFDPSSRSRVHIPDGPEAIVDDEDDSHLWAN
jgi:P27 family predicted phage terminase small subunit